MASRNEVDLIVKATDETSKVITTVKKAFNDFLGVQQTLVKDGKDLNNSFADTAKRAADLAKQVGGLKALGTIATSASEAAAALDRIGASVKRQESDVVNLGKTYNEAATATKRLREQMDAEKAVLAETRAVRDAERTSLTNYTQQVKDAQAALRALNKEQQAATPSKGVGVEAGAAVSSAKSSAAAFLTADLEKAREVQAQSKATVDAYNASIKEQQVSIKGLSPIVSAAAANEAKLNGQLDKSASALDRENSAFNTATVQYRELAQLTAQASQLSGVEVVNQDKVAAAYAKTTAELAKANAAIASYNKASGDFVSPTNVGAAKTTRSDTGQVTAIDADRRQAISQMRDLQQQLASAQVEAQKFNKALAQSDGPTTELGAAAGAAQGRVRALKEELAQVQGALRANQSSFQQFSQAATESTKPVGLIQRILQQIRPAADDASQSNDKLNQSMKNSANSSREALSLFQRVRGEILALTTSYIGLQAAISQIGNVITAFQSLEGAQSRLGAVFNQDTGRISQELDFLQQNAERLGISFQTLADQYSKFAVAAKAANFQSQATRDIFISVAEAGRVNKLSVDQLNGVFLALEQMISKGKVSSEELRRQLGDRLPGAFNIFASAIGVSTAQLDKMMRSGQVLADQSTLLKFADELTRRFGPQLSDSLKTTSAELGRFSNNIFESQLRVANGGFIDAFTKGLQALNGVFESRAGRDFFLSLGAAMGKVVDGIVILAQHSSELLTVLGAIAVLKINSVFQSLVANLVNSAKASIAASAGMFTWSGTLQAVEGKLTALRGVITGTNGVITSFRTQLGAVGIAASTAGARFVAMEAGLAGLRVAAGLAAGVFRTLWAAIGGLPGLILTGVTIALGQWLTKVDDTTAALDEHKRIMGEVQKAYDKVKGTTEDWAKELKNVSLVDLEKNFRNATDEVQKATRDLSSGIGKQLEGGFFGGVTFGLLDSTQTTQLNALVKNYASGSINVKDFRDQLVALNADLTDDSVKKAAGELIDYSNVVLENTDRQTAAAAAAVEYGSKSEAAGEIVAKTGAKVQDLNKAQTDSIDIHKKLSDEGSALNDILGKMEKAVEKVGDEFKRLETLNGLQKQFNDAKQLVHSVQELLELQGKYNTLSGQAIDNSIGSNSSIVDKIIGAEGNDASKNPDSSAQGLGQFISSTWLRMFKQYFPDRAASMSDAMILELRKDADLNRNMIALYVQENAKVLNQAGVAVTDANLYLSHFLGAGDATKVLKASPGTPLQGLISDKSIAANPTVLGGGKTTDDAIAFATKRVGASKEEAAIEGELQKIDEKRAAKAKDYTTDLDNRLSLQAQEIDNAGKLTQEAYVQKALDGEMKKAREAGVTLSDQQIDLIKQQAAAEWQNKQAKVDGNTATKEANTSLQQAVALAAQRNALEKQFKDAQASGNTDLTATLQTQLDGVNSKLTDAIEKARGMWEAIGGDTAKVALTKLDTLQVKIDSSKKSYGLFGLKAQDVQSLVSSGVDGFVGIFSSFAQAIATGQNAFKALGTAFLQFAASFLQQIATMILKQMLFNLLAGFGGPIGAAAKAAGGVATAHTGGVVGGNFVGVGNASRSVSPGIFSTAMRYHDGGIAGLRPNEVPTILNRGEEVLTQNDPRHRDNGGMAPSGGSAAQPVAIRNVVTLDPSFAADMVNSASGEQAVISVLKKNKATLRSIVGQ